MKEIYEKPAAEIEEFKRLDIMTTSNPGDDNDVKWGE